MAYRQFAMSNTVKVMAAKFPSKCIKCHFPIAVGEMIIFRARPNGVKSAEHELQAGCDAAKAKATAGVGPAAQLDLSSIVEFLKAAATTKCVQCGILYPNIVVKKKQHVPCPKCGTQLLPGLLRPKFRVLSTDGRTELRLSITRAGVAPGSIAVVARTSMGDDYLGGVRPTGAVVGKLNSNIALQQHLLKVAADPAAAAKQYAGVMSACGFCSKPLTDEGSIAHGYGPICAVNWGLKHIALGSTVLTAVPGTPQSLPLTGVVKQSSPIQRLLEEASSVEEEEDDL